MFEMQNSQIIFHKTLRNMKLKTVFIIRENDLKIFSKIPCISAFENQSHSQYHKSTSQVT